MNRNFEKALSEVLKHEGGFVNHPKDPGGATNKGITFGTYRRYINRSGTVDDLRRITDEQVARVYRRHYWDKIKGDELPSGVDFAVFDFAVNSGPSRAAKFLQSLVGATQDGKIGPRTLAATINQPSVTLINALMDKRLAWLKRLRTWRSFGRGWSRRIDGVRTVALQMTAKRHKRTPNPIKPRSSLPSRGWWASFIAWLQNRP